MSSMRAAFRVLNRFFMIPVFRLGLGSLIVNPISGYIMVLRTVGHTSGKFRYVPVNYAVDGGCLYCFAGLGKAAHWYRNLQADPNANVILPGGAVFGRAEPVTDPVDRLRVGRKVLRSGGLAGFFAGVNPFTCTDEQLAVALSEGQILRIRPQGFGSGPADPGGWGWVTAWMLGMVCVIAALVILG
jgi:hypothetical protein